MHDLVCALILCFEGMVRSTPSCLCVCMYCCVKVAFILGQNLQLFKNHVAIYYTYCTCFCIWEDLDP